MLKTINKKYIVFATLLYMLIAALFPVEMKALYALNYFTILVFALLVDYLLKQPDAYYTRKKMIFLVFYYSLFYIFCYNLISYFYTGNLYIFSEADAVLYHEESQVMANMPFFKSIDYYLSRHEMEDLGIVLVMSNLYKIAGSKILLNAFYLIIALVTANGMYGIARHFMTGKYAFLCAVFYSFSSYMLWFHSSGLKESLLVVLIVQFYNSYYAIIFDKKTAAIWGLVLVPLLLMLFRPVLAMFCILSVVVGLVLKKKLTVPQLILLIFMVIATLYYTDAIMGSTDKFLLGGTDAMLEIKEMEGMVKGSVSFTYLVNTLSSMFGPFPSIVSTKTHLSFYAPGLIFKILLSLAFWFGVVHIIRIRLYRTYPMLIFALVEMASLTYILEALELRKSLPHFPLVYIIAFIFVFQFDHNQLITIKNHLFYKKSYNILALVLCILVVYWNFR
jgi:hypothetical protein